MSAFNTISQRLNECPCDVWWGYCQTSIRVEGTTRSKLSFVACTATHFQISLCCGSDGCVTRPTMTHITGSTTHTQLEFPCVPAHSLSGSFNRCVAIVADPAGQIAACQHVWSPTHGLWICFPSSIHQVLAQARPRRYQPPSFRAFMIRNIYFILLVLPYGNEPEVGGGVDEVYIYAFLLIVQYICGVAWL